MVAGITKVLVVLLVNAIALSTQQHPRALSKRQPKGTMGDWQEIPEIPPPPQNPRISSNPARPQQPRKPDPARPQQPRKPDPARPQQPRKPDPAMPQQPGHAPNAAIGRWRRLHPQTDGDKPTPRADPAMPQKPDPAMSQQPDPTTSQQPDPTTSQQPDPAMSQQPDANHPTTGADPVMPQQPGAMMPRWPSPFVYRWPYRQPDANHSTPGTPAMPQQPDPAMSQQPGPTMPPWPSRTMPRWPHPQPVRNNPTPGRPAMPQQPGASTPRMPVYSMPLFPHHDPEHPEKGVTITNQTLKDPIDLPVPDISNVQIESTKSCSVEDGIVLRPIGLLESWIKGKVTSNATIHPSKPPQVCDEVTRAKNRHLCYNAWGFTDRVSQCYGLEEVHQDTICHRHCYENIGFKYYEDKGNQACQECLAGVKETRHKCTLEAMNISMPCQDCYLKAQSYYHQACSMDCYMVFDHIEQNDTVTVPRCRKCNDAVFQMINECGI